MTGEESRGAGGAVKVLLAFPSSNENVRADLRALQRSGMLELFCTTIAWRRDHRLAALLPARIREELARRAYDDIDPARIKTFPLREAARQIAERIGLTMLTRYETGWASMDGVSRAFDAQVARLIRSGSVQASAVYAYDYAALRAFEAAAAVGMRRFYELPTGYWRAGVALLQEERERAPEWAATMTMLLDSAEKHARKDAEICAADHIVVPSRFVRDSLREHPGFSATIDVIPYGAPRPRPAAIAARGRSERLRLLYVGNLTQQKGLSYLFAAMAELRGIASLTLVGAKPIGRCAALEAELERHDWLGAVPHERVLEIAAAHDVLVFPSLFEGFGLVILEAMAQGLPVIATVNTAGRDVIDDGVDGFVVPIRDAHAIASRVRELATDPERRAAMSLAAVAKAGRLSWDAHEEAFLAAIRHRIGEGSAR